MRSVAVSEACSTTTIGAGDATAYWDFQHRTVQRTDLGHRCRECRLAFDTLGEPLTERRGARVSMRYHAVCFSGFADPRSQAASSHHVGHLAGSQFESAPTSKAGTKMRTSEHFTGGGAVRGGGGGGTAGGSLGKISGFGSNSFGAKSSKGRVHVPPPRAPGATGGLTEAALAEHTRNMRIDEEKPGGDWEG